MTKLEVRQQKKNEALNEIRKIYHPKYNFPYCKYDGSYSEQRETNIKEIIEKLERELKL